MVVAVLIVEMEGTGVVLVKEAGAFPFLHIIRLAIATEANSPSKVGPGKSLERGRQGEEIREGEWSYIRLFLKLTMGEVVCQRRCSSLMINAREILITLILSKGFFQVFNLQLTCKDVCSSEEAGG